jgi:hypothetical protein
MSSSLTSISAAGHVACRRDQSLSSHGFDCVEALQVESYSLAGACFGQGVAMNLHSPYAGLACSRRLQLELIAYSDVTGNQRTRDYGAESLNRENAVYWQSRDCF